MPFNEFKQVLLKEAALIEPGTVVAETDAGKIVAIDSVNFDLHPKSDLSFHGTGFEPGEPDRFQLNLVTLNVEGLVTYPFSYDSIVETKTESDYLTEEEEDFLELFNEFFSAIDNPSYNNVQNKLQRNFDVQKDKKKRKGQKADPNSGIRWAIQRVGFEMTHPAATSLWMLGKEREWALRQLSTAIENGVTAEQLKKFVDLILGGARKNN